ncbi:MAG: 3-dehydroquinate synthase II [Candidatus Altiarchaeales archaeon ex4484_2]|nr:MAG: 3-dehydroquinate synthase II [Candidatus Altiarchaeales archaeon ex4484_2]
MKELWLHIKGDWKNEKKKVQAGIESGFVTFYVEEPELLKKITELAAVKTALESDDGADGDADIIVSRVKHKPENSRSCFHIEIKDKGDERKAVSMVKQVDYLLINTGKDIIPLENIISEAQGLCKVVAEIGDVRQAETVLKALEVGADGILYRPKNVDEVRDLFRVYHEFEAKKVDLVKATVTKIKPTGMGSRVCIDTCSMMHVGEGNLIGSQSNAFFLVHSESVKNPYVATRPFRVNAGPVHSYILLPDGRTKYLSELKAGDEVLVVDNTGKSRVAIVGRLKIEERPLLLVEANSDSRKISILLQNAETIRLVNEKGEPVSVAKLREGDRILVHLEEGGRHFGKKVKESITEK